ncbi:MAG: erythromycin esterase family protein [Caldilineaceae bacterium]
MTTDPSPDTEHTTETLSATISKLSHPLASNDDLDPLLEHIGDARYVLLGEASHGTSDYYTWRARLSQRLITEKGFSFIAVEGDWPDCYAVNRYVKGYRDAGTSARAVLQNFSRWPTWMWANWEIVALTEWLRAYNQAGNRQGAAQVGFYGLDVYSLWASMASIIDYLTKHVPEALDIARRAYLCFEPYGKDVQSYAWRTSIVPETCEDEVVELLQTVRRNVSRYPTDPETSFDVEQNALITVDAERYYRAMVRGGAGSWNVRDRHMVATLARLMAHHANLHPDGKAKAIVWEHNTHIGDARATDMSRAGMVNVGQLVREQHEREGVVLVGCGTYHGSVIAGEEWGAPMRRMAVPTAQPNSWEMVLHQSNPGDQLLLSHELQAHKATLAPRGQRAIGVVYQPEREGLNYVPTILPQRYDAFLFLNETTALHPLHLEPQTDKPPDTYPWGV